MGCAAALKPEASVGPETPHAQILLPVPGRSSASWPPTPSGQNQIPGTPHSQHPEHAENPVGAHEQSIVGSFLDMPGPVIPSNFWLTQQPFLQRLRKSQCTAFTERQIQRGFTNLHFHHHWIAVNVANQIDPSVQQRFLKA